MIKVTVKRDSQGRVTFFQMRGHAGYAKAGTDIVCAAASVLVQNGVNSIEALLNVEIPTVSRDGFVEGKVPEMEGHVSEQVQLLLESMVYGLRALADEYPGHVSVSDNE